MAEVQTEYVSLDEVKRYLGEDADNFDDGTLTDHILAAQELIDGHCKGHFSAPVPALCKMAAKRLVQIFCSDPTKQSESTADYSYTSNKSAIKGVFDLLDQIPDKDFDTQMAKAHRVSAKVV